MFYEYNDKKLFEFVDNPVNNIDYLFKLQSPLSLRSKILYLFPFFRKFISAQDSKKIFEHLFSLYLKETLEEIKNLKPYLHDTHDPDYSEKIFKEFTNFFNIGFVFDHDDFIDLDKDSVMSFLKTNLLTKLNYHCNRISESFDLAEDYYYSIATNEKLWLSFFLSEVYLLLKSNVFRLILDKNNIIFKLNNRFDESIKGYWISETLEDSSKMADSKVFSLILPHIEKDGTIPNELANVVINYILDKVFSINTRYISKAMNVNQKYLFLREVIFFSLILECYMYIGKYFISREYFLKSKNISNESLLFIEQELYDICDDRINNIGGFIHRVAPSSYKRGSLSFKYGLRQFAGFMLNAKQKQLGNTDFKGEIGNLFERDYVLHYLKDIGYFGYVPFDGFKAGNKSEVKDYDIDIVLYDNKNNIYYFIQVKYKFSALPTYFTEQCKLFNDKEFRKGYMKQLLSLKANFNHPSIRNQLNNKNLSGAKLENSYFILLHNIPFLNFYEYEGVFFYEWNLLRNILQDGKMHWLKDEEYGTHTTVKKLQLHMPNEIIDAYFNNSMFGHDLKQYFKLFKRSKCIFNMGEKNIQCPML